MKFFVNSASLLDLSLPAHNEALVDDSLYSIQFNFEWRRLVTSALVYFFRHGESDLALDNEDLLDDILFDLYNAESSGDSMLSRSLSINLTSNKTTSSTTYVAVANSSFNHTFTKANALIRCSNLILNAATGETVTVKIDLATMSPVAVTELIVAGSTPRTIACAHVYEAIPAGTLAVSLVWKVSGGTGTMNATALMLYEIIEYD